MASLYSDITNTHITIIQVIETRMNRYYKIDNVASWINALLRWVFSMFELATQDEIDKLRTDNATGSDKKSSEDLQLEDLEVKNISLKNIF